MLVAPDISYIVYVTFIKNDTQIKKIANEIIYIPKCPQYLSPILSSIPLQLLSYHIAVKLDCDVDQPRNLAKSVTVELKNHPYRVDGNRKSNPWPTIK